MQPGATPPTPTPSTLIGAGNILQHQPLQPPPMAMTMPMHPHMPHHLSQAQQQTQQPPLYFPSYQPGHVFIPQYNPQFMSQSSLATLASSEEATSSLKQTQMETPKETKASELKQQADTSYSSSSELTTGSLSSSVNTGKSTLNPNAGEFIPTFSTGMIASPIQQTSLPPPVPQPIQIITTASGMQPMAVPGYHVNFPEFQPQQQQYIMPAVVTQQG